MKKMSCTKCVCWFTLWLVHLHSVLRILPWCLMLGQNITQQNSTWWQHWLVIKPYFQTTVTEQLMMALACCQTLLSDNSERAVGDSTGLLWSLIPDNNERAVEKGHRHIMWHHFQTSVTEQWVTEQLCRVASFWENSDRAAGSITGMMCSFIFRWQQ